MLVVLALVLLLFLLGTPYALYFDSQKLDKPIVVFTTRIWRVAYCLLITIVFAGFLLIIAGLLATRPNVGVAGLLGALALFSLGWSFLVLRLHLSYWRHDQDATLTVHRQESRAEYCNNGIFLRFALADAVQITEYATRGFRGVYSYQIFILQDGTELLVTCLMYSFLGPQELMPAAARHTVPRTICWQPGDELIFPTLF
ncbi:hypothetical protein [Hymenobacter psoromatis]|uniref:hypothetical protein n=1 Tax=Hymenobacter psoromatis TaxID=1484116 RepID=UPI001CBB906E|nr:hypothetical protein [Hymenobacter psoromatis]